MSLYISISKSYLTISFLLMISVACDILCCISTTRVELLRVLCLMWISDCYCSRRSLVLRKLVQ